jgi:hypothetical protein
MFLITRICVHGKPSKLNAFARTLGTLCENGFYPPIRQAEKSSSISFAKSWRRLASGALRPAINALQARGGRFIIARAS